VRHFPSAFVGIRDTQPTTPKAALQTTGTPTHTTPKAALQTTGTPTHKLTETFPATPETSCTETPNAKTTTSGGRRLRPMPGDESSDDDLQDRHHKNKEYYKG